MGNMNFYTHIVQKHSDGFYSLDNRTDKLSPEEFHKLQRLIQTESSGFHKWIVFANYSKNN